MSSAETDETLRELERAVFDAFEQPGDAQAIAEIYADDFLAINADASVTDRQTVLEILDVPASSRQTRSRTTRHRSGASAILPL